MAVLTVPIELDKRRNLRFGMRAMTEIEKLYPAESITEIFERLYSSPRITMVCEFLRAGLCHEDKSLTTDMLIDVIDNSGKDLGEIMELLRVALDEAMKPKNGTAGAVEEKATPA